MGGMGGGSGVNDPTVVAAFHRALLEGGLVVAVLAVLLFVSWRWCRARQLQAAVHHGDTVHQLSANALVEPGGRRLLRIGFGLLWLFDGVLQGQASMPLGMVPEVIHPAAQGSPTWVRHLVDSTASVWTYHPVSVAASTVWIQVGLGLLLLVSGSGTWSRLAGVGSAAWGLIIWVFGEAFGEIFAPGLTWLFGAPGAASFYVVAGVLIAFPERVWRKPSTGRALLRGLGAFFAGMALLQAWPGRGFWQGHGGPSGAAGTLTAMLQDMAATPQPHPVASTVQAFARFDASHGWAVNLFAVVALAVTGALLVAGRGPVLRGGLIAAAVLCLADWILVQDLGFMGGVGTDPNSMLPLLVLLGGGYLASVREPQHERPATARVALEPDESTWRQRLIAEPVHAFRVSAALAAVGVTLVGAAPMAVAATRSAADPILASAISGPPENVDRPAAPFTLTDQHGRAVSLRSLRGYAIMLTFLDPVCTTDCPVVAAEMRDADRLLGPDARRVRMVAVNANRILTDRAYLEAFDRQVGLDQLPNWLYLTGSPSQLQAVWNGYGVDVEAASGGSMMDHNDVAFLIDRAGHVRQILDTDPGPASAASRSSFGRDFADLLLAVLHK